MYTSRKRPRHGYMYSLALYRYRVLRIDQSSGVGDPGKILWDLCLCLLLAWIIVFCCLVKGVKSSGKVRHKIFQVVFLEKVTSCSVLLHQTSCVYMYVCACSFFFWIFMTPFKRINISSLFENVFSHHFPEHEGLLLR